MLSSVRSGGSISEEGEAMTLGEVQREMREVFVNGSVGQAVSGVIWLVSAAMATER